MGMVSSVAEGAFYVWGPNGAKLDSSAQNSCNGGSKMIIRNAYSLFVIVPLVLISLMTGAPVAPAGLSYVESSNGLETPHMEGGRTEIELGDVNGDGNPDLVSIGDHGSPYVNTNEHGVMVWFGDGEGRWSVFQNGDFGYGGVALGDANNDGLMDVGYAMHHNYSGVDFGDQLIEVALGDGSGRAWKPWDDGLATNGETWGMFGTAFADVDNDGLLDIASISFGCCSGLHVYRNNGNGTWSQTFGFDGGNSDEDIATGDVNGDGLADLAVAHQYGTVYLGDGKGGFQLADGNLPPGGSRGRLGIALGDVDKDGRDELSFCTSTGGVAVWHWTPGNMWQNLSGSLPQQSCQATQLYDINGDGLGDVAAYMGAGIVIYAGNGAGEWTKAAAFRTAGSVYTAFRVGGDADHNGFADIALVAEEGGVNHLRFYKEASSPTSLRIRTVSPHGGEIFYAGSTHFIDWSSAVPDGSSSVSLEFSTAGPGGLWQRIAYGLPNNGRYQWHIPRDTPASTGAYLRLIVTDRQGVAQAVTAAPFTVHAPAPR